MTSEPLEAVIRIVTTSLLTAMITLPVLAVLLNKDVPALRGDAT